MAERHLFTSESVTEGHPDKIADQISDSVLDALIAQDKQSRVACETLVTTGLAIVAGEISSRGYVEIPELVRRVIGEIGYDSAEYGFDSHTCAVVTTIDNQSGDIAMGVDTGGAGDQGLMFGFACRETPQLMPLPIMLAHALTRRLALVRRKGLVPYLRPDGKSQVTVQYEGARPVKVDTVVVSSQHAEDVPQAKIRRDIMKHVIEPVIPKRYAVGRMTCHINPTGSFVKGGPMADTGLTGRKIIVDTYGGVGSHGGGAFSGKDTNGTGKVKDNKLTDLVRKHFDLTPKGLIEHLKLRRPIYRKTAAYGHFGRSEASFTWEKTDKARLLAKSV